MFSKKWTAKVPFEKLTFEPPVTSGPYLIERYDAGRGIIFKRDPNYWGKDLAVRRGTFNFARVVYRLYKDETAKLEAYKAGEFDAIVEYRAKNWAKSYQGTRFRNGPNPVLYCDNPPGMSAVTRRQVIDSINELNSMHLADFGDPETEARIRSFERSWLHSSLGCPMYTFERTGGP